MIEEKFKVIQLLKKFIEVLENELENFPRKDSEIKSKLRFESYDLLELLSYANLTQNTEIKKETLWKCISKVKVIDYLINLSYDRKLISEKKYLRLGENLNELIKYISGWQKSVIEPKTEKRV